MAKSKNRSNSRGRRVILNNANNLLLPAPMPLNRVSMQGLKTLPSLSVYEDRRSYHPIGLNAPARSFSRSRHRLKVSHAAPRSKALSSPTTFTSHIAFQSPSRVLVCVRRQRRKEVIHALGKSGRSGQRRPRRSEYSSISCKG